jgi:hypothetical protein
MRGRTHPATDARDAAAEARRAAREAAEVEGLRLERTDGASGFKGVYREEKSKSKPFQARALLIV